VTQTHEELGRRLVALRAEFAALGGRAAGAAGALTSTLPPPSVLLEELSAARTSFTDLRSTMLEHAGSLAVVLDTEGVESCRDLEPVLAAIRAAEEQRARVAAWEAARESVLVVLDRVMALIHREEKGFTPLVECRERAREMHAALSGAPPDDLEHETKMIPRKVRPYLELVALVDGWNALDDDRCAYLQDSITQAFSRPLALAALRGKLGREGEVLPPTPKARNRAAAAVAAPVEPVVAPLESAAAAIEPVVAPEPEAVVAAPVAEAPAVPAALAAPVHAAPAPAAPVPAAPAPVAPTGPIILDGPLFVPVAPAARSAPAPVAAPYAPAASHAPPAPAHAPYAAPAVPQVSAPMPPPAPAPPATMYASMPGAPGAATATPGAPPGSPLVVEIRLSGDRVSVETPEARREREATLERLAQESARWWIAARSGWYSMRERGMTFGDAVHDYLKAYPHLLAVPLPKSHELAGGHLAEGYALLLAHIEKQEEGFVQEALTRLNPQFTTRSREQSYPLGQELYLYVVAEGRLYKTYPDFVKEVLINALPKPGIWIQGGVTEADEETRLFTRPEVPGSPQEKLQTVSDPVQRTGPHVFGVTTGPLTTRVFTLHLANQTLADPPDVEILLKENGAPSDHAWILTLAAPGKPQALAPRKHRVGGTKLAELGREFGGLWIAVFNADPNSDRSYELSITLRRKAPIPPKIDTKPVAAATASKFFGRKR
jgi:hypothetical protein